MEGSSGLAGGFCLLAAAIVHAFGQFLQFGGRQTQGVGAVAAYVGHDLVVEIGDDPLEVFFDALGGVLKLLSPASGIGSGVLVWHRRHLSTFKYRQVENGWSIPPKRKFGPRACLVMGLEIWAGVGLV